MNRKHARKLSYARAAGIALIAMALLLAIWWQAGSWYRSRLMAEARASAYVELTPYGNALVSAVQRRIALLKGLAAFVNANPSRSYLDARFQNFIRHLSGEIPGIRYLAVAPDGVNAYVYPLKGNETINGLDLRKYPHPHARKALQGLLRSGGSVLIGPLPLKGGQTGIMACQAVTVEGKFWGVVSIAIQLRPLLVEAGIVNGGHGLRLALSSGSGEVVFSQNAVLEADPVRYRLQVAGKTAYLAAVPENGWESALGREWLTYRIAGLTLIGLLALMIFFLFAYQERLRRAVIERTRSLKEELQERWQAQVALQQSEVKYKNLYNSIRDAILVVDSDRRILHCNAAFTELFGYGLEEIEGESTRMLCENDEEYRRFSTAIENNKDKQSFITTIRYRKKNGAAFPAEVNLFYMKDALGRVTGYIGMSRDITKQAETMNSLREREEQFRTLAELAPTAIAIMSGTPPNEYLYVNSAWVKLTGYSKEEARTLKPIDMVHPDLRKIVQGRADARIRGEPVSSRYELQIVTRDGRKRWLDFAAAVSNYLGEKVIITVANDITGQKEAEEALRNSEAMFRNLFEGAPVGIFRTSSKGYFLNVNPGMAKLLGADSPEQVLSHYTDIAHQLYAEPEKRKQLMDWLDQHGRFENFEIEMKRMDGRHVWIALNARVSQRFDDGSFYLDGFAGDITERRQAQVRAVHLNRILRSMRDIDHLISREKDPEEMIRQVCNILVKNRGYFGAMIALVDSSGRPVQYAEAGIGEAFDRMKDSFEKGAVPSCCIGAETPNGAHPQADGPAVCVSCPIGESCSKNQIMCRQMAYEGKIYGYIAVSTIRGQEKDAEEQELFNETAVDVAFALNNIEREKHTRRAEEARERAEEQLLQSQKMEAVGRLAGGIAHDFNNMLNVILGYASIARSRLDKEHSIYDYLIEIEQAAQRSAELTGQLLAFSRKQITEPRVININEIIDEHRTLLNRLIGEEIDIRFQPEEGVWNIRVDPFQIDQILTNLAVNARDAIGGMGTVIICTENKTIGPSDQTAELPPGDYVLLTFSDTGIGMDAATMEQIFEPFFTTKDTGKGTGLGLSTVYGIVKQNGGAIEVESEPDKGTMFNIYFPRHLAETDAVAEGMPKDVLHGSETVLVVEDEEQVLNLAEMILKDFGYTVLKARSPKEAVSIAREYDGPIDLLLTDVIMPEMNGVALKQEVENALSERVKTVFMSGYSDDIISRQGILEGHFLVKPFTVDSLATRVREAIDS